MKPNISFFNLEKIYSLCSQTGIISLRHIKTVYSNQYRDFELHFNMLQEMRIVEVRDNRIEVMVTEEGLKEFIIKRIFAQNIYDPLAKFLLQFSLSDGVYKLPSTKLMNIEFQSERKFLAQMGVIQEVEGVFYVCSDELQTRILMNKRITLEMLDKALVEQRNLGTDAENFVVEEEKKKATSFPNVIPMESIYSVSKNAANAGFDIVSFNTQQAQQGKHEQIYIEVKTFSGGIKNFYWTHNEIQIAKLLARKYYLYIVENFNNRFEISAVVPNPYDFFIVRDNWRAEPTDYHIIEDM